MHLSLAKGALLANAVACLALAAVLADTRRGLDAVQAEHPPTAVPHRALDGEEEGADALMRRQMEKEAMKEAEAIVVDRVDAALVKMRGELEAARREGAEPLANATEFLGARVERLERDVDGLRSSRGNDGGANRRRRPARRPATGPRSRRAPTQR